MYCKVTVKLPSREDHSHSGPFTICTDSGGRIAEAIKVLESFTLTPGFRFVFETLEDKDVEGKPQ